MRIASLSRLALLLCLLSLLSACAVFGEEHQPETETLPVAQLYQQGHEALLDHNYPKAERYYRRLTARFPFGPYTEQAKLDLAYVLYKGDKPDDAYSTISRFIRTYPAQEHIDYAFYLRGLINFNRDRSFFDDFFGSKTAQRDPSYDLKSFHDFSLLLKRYPDSKYADDARQRMVYLRNLLAQHELNVAMYYLRRDAWVGASLRSKYIIEHYQTSPQTADALAIMAKSYSNLGQDKLAGDVIQVLKTNYPDHPYLADHDWPDFPSSIFRLIPFTSHG